MMKSYFWRITTMKKMKFCPRCNLKMKKVNIRKMTSYNTPDGSSFGMFSDFTPVTLGGNVAISQQVLMCPRCGRQVPLEVAKVTKSIKAAENANLLPKKKVNKKQLKKQKKWKTFLGVLIILILLVILAGPALYLWQEFGNMPAAISDFLTKLFG